MKRIINDKIIIINVLATLKYQNDINISVTLLYFGTAISNGCCNNILIRSL